MKIIGNWRALPPSIQKIVRVMKVSVFLVLVCTLQLSASVMLGQQVNLQSEEMTVREVFKELKTQTGTYFMYSEKEVDADVIVKADFSDVSLEEALDDICEQASLQYEIVDDYVLITKKAPVIKQPVQQEKKTIKGKVTDKEGTPLPGVSVIIKGTTMGVATDIDGNYSIEFDQDNVVLVFSFVGMLPQELAYTGQVNQNITLTTDTETMDEVVVTGYQTISAERSAGSFSLVKNTSIKEKSGTMNVVDRLEGLVPGLTVNHSEGAEKFLIRGVTSINASKMPLFVLDGVPIDYEDFVRLVNPNDVANISVLKDATAASIWGAQAANGVIVITTKKGESGKMKVTYDGFISLKGLPDYSYQDMMSTEQFINAAREIFNPNVYTYDIVTSPQGINLPVLYPHEKILYDEHRGIISSEQANEQLNALASLNNRSQIEEYFMQPSRLTSHSLSVSGGSIFHNYHGSFSYTNDKGVDKSGTERYMLNLRQNFKFNSRINLDLTINLSKETTEEFSMSGLPSLDGYLPYAMFADDNGNHLSHSDLKLFEEYRQNAEELSGINLGYNPLDEAQFANDNQINTTTARVNAGLQIEIAKGLKYEGRYQYQSGTSNRYNFLNENAYDVRLELVNFTQAGTPPAYFLPSQGGHYTTGSNRSISWSIRNQFIYQNDWKDKTHQLTMLGGAEIRKSLMNANTSFRRGFDMQTLTYELYDDKTLSSDGLSDPVIPNHTSGRSILTGADPILVSESDVRFVSFYGNMAYTYKQRYNLNASIRMDQSNLFGADFSQQYKPIWSVGGSWKISDESFFNSNTFNRLNLRLTYGIGGNSPDPGSGGPYDILAAKTPSSWYSGLGNPYQIVLPDNDNLVWEKTSTLNIGVDATLFKNRLFLTMDVYDKKTSDLLGTQSLDPTNGWFQGYTNLGDISNKGIELSVTSRNIDKENFSWSTNITFAYNKNKVISLGNVTPLTPTGKLLSHGFVEGYSAFSIFATDWAGLDENGNPQAYNSEGEKVSLLQDLENEDIKHVGTTQPVYSGGINNTFRYKSWELSSLIIYNLGHKMRDAVNQFYTGRLGTNIPVYFEDRWKEPGDENLTNVPAYIADAGLDGNRSTSLYTHSNINILDAGYFKIRDITLAYNLPQTVIKSLKLRDVRIYAQVNNILLWTANNSGLDPEYHASGDGFVSSSGGSASSSGGTYVGRGSVRAVKMPPFWTFGARISF